MAMADGAWIAEVDVCWYGIDVMDGSEGSKAIPKSLEPALYNPGSLNLPRRHAGDVNLMRMRGEGEGMPGASKAGRFPRGPYLLCWHS